MSEARLRKIYNPDSWPVDEYEAKTVKVDDEGGLTITETSGWTFGCTPAEAKGKPIPEPGQPIVLLGGFGHQIRGIFINGVQYRYITKKQADAERREWLADYDRRKEEDFQANIARWIERKNALDEPFRNRMDRFANKGFKEFWKESGIYELFAVEQANELLKEAIRQDDPVEWLNDFYDAKWEKQKELFPGLDDDHSGNTFGAMVGLARAVAEGKPI